MGLAFRRDCKVASRTALTRSGPHVALRPRLRAISHRPFSPSAVKRSRQEAHGLAIDLQRGRNRSFRILPAPQLTQCGTVKRPAAVCPSRLPTAPFDFVDPPKPPEQPSHEACPIMLASSF